VKNRRGSISRKKDLKKDNAIDYIEIVNLKKKIGIHHFFRAAIEPFGKRSRDR
jgi:hypothetical protein